MKISVERETALVCNATANSYNFVKVKNQPPTNNRENYKNLSSYYKAMIFLFQLEFYRQKFGLPMGSLLSGVLA